MTVKLTVLYDQPADPEAFDRHYLDVHMPLAMKIPDVQRAETARMVPGPDGSVPPYYRIAELYFADGATAGAALASAEGQAAARDAMELAEGKVKFLMCELDE